MSQEHADFAEPGGRRRSPLPTVILWVCVGVMVLTIFGVAWLQAMAFDQYTPLD